MNFLASLSMLGSGTIVSIAIISLLYILLSAFIQRKLSNAIKLRQLQQQIKQLTKDLNSMNKSGASQAELAAKQKEIMPLVTESMKRSMRPLIVLFPLTLIFYYVLVPALPFVTKSNIGTIDDLFIIILVVGGIIAGLILGKYDNMAVKKASDMKKEMQKDISLEVQKE